MDNQEISNKIAQILEDEGSYSIRSYSGRGMYGKSCIGFDVGNTSDMLKIILILAANTDEEGIEDWLFDLAENARTDSMGMGQIIYFPKYPPATNIEDDDEEEDDE